MKLTILVSLILLTSIAQAGIFKASERHVALANAICASVYSDAKEKAGENEVQRLVCTTYMTNQIWLSGSYRAYANDPELIHNDRSYHSFNEYAFLVTYNAVRVQLRSAGYVYRGDINTKYQLNKIYFHQSSDAFIEFFSAQFEK